MSVIEIHEGFSAHDNANILPVRRCESERHYEGKEDEQISICCYYSEGYLEMDAPGRYVQQ